MEYLIILFYGINIKKQNTSFFLKQETYISNIQKLVTNAMLEKFGTTRQKRTWISQTGPEIIASHI